MDITKQHQEQQEAKRQQGKISSFIRNFQVGTLLNKNGIRKFERDLAPDTFFRYFHVAF